MYAHTIEEIFNGTHTDCAQVIKALQSLNSRGYVKTQFSWQWYVLTPPTQHTNTPAL